MTDNNSEIDYKAKYDEVVAERDALSSKLDEYIGLNNKLKADLKVSQQINRATIGSDTPPKEPETHRMTLAERVVEYKKSLQS